MLQISSPPSPWRDGRGRVCRDGFDGTQNPSPWWLEAHLKLSRSIGHLRFDAGVVQKKKSFLMLKEKRNNFQRKKCQKISCHVSIHPTDHLLSKAEHTTSATNAIATVNANQLSFFTHPFTSRTRAVVFSLPLYFRLHITRQFTTNMSNPAHVCSSAGGLPKEAITSLVCHLPANLSPRPQAEGKPS